MIAGVPVAPAVAPVRPYADPEEIPLVTPLHIFAARRQSFDVIVRQRCQMQAAVALIFDALPLIEYGWDVNNFTAVRIGHCPDRYPIWRLSRGP